MFRETLRENLMVAAPDPALREALRTVGADWADDLDRDLGEHPLDGAQAQQLALARVRGTVALFIQVGGGALAAST